MRKGQNSGMFGTKLNSLCDAYCSLLVHTYKRIHADYCEQMLFNPYPTAFPYGNGMVLHFYQQQESTPTKTIHKVINKGLKTYV